MSVSGKLCVLTVHGIGFQQPPTATAAGYADILHENLSHDLEGLLGSDPQRVPGPYGPVYVMSAMPGTNNKEWGLSRLGTWRADGIDTSDAPLTAGDEPIAHVALVYTSLEGVGPRIGTGVGTVGEAGLMLSHYASVAGTIRLVAGDTWAALQERPPRSAKAISPSLHPRTDIVLGRRHHHAGLLHREPDHSGAIGVIRALEDDVVAYVCRNDLRERVREFIGEALRRLLARPDVAGVVVNAHSQGTVASFDVLRLYPADPPPAVRAFVTAGCPLRKYGDLFAWGNDAGGIHSIRWLNFWDEKDPVADPLTPPASWHFGDHADTDPAELGLFWSVDGTGQLMPVTITDKRVNNLRYSYGGGLQAHNYWDNKHQFIAEVAKLLKTTLAAPAQPT